MKYLNAICALSVLSVIVCFGHFSYIFFNTFLYYLDIFYFEILVMG